MRVNRSTMNKRRKTVSNFGRDAVTILWFWSCAILGTSIGGSLFGIIGGPVGMIFGFLIAFAVGAPIHGTVLLLTLVGPLTRFRFALAVVAGGLAGIFSTRAAGLNTTPMVTAAFLGCATTFVTLRWFFARTSLGKRFANCSPATHQYSLGETFVFLTIVAALCGGWSIASARIPRAETNLNPGQLPTELPTIDR